MFPGLNGHLLTSNSATAWPHAVAGRQTLFSPAWSLAQDDGLAANTTEYLNQIKYDRQKELGELSLITQATFLPEIQDIECGETICSGSSR